MIIDTYKYPISLYAICFIISIFLGFALATVILVRKKANRTAIICSLLLNVSLLLYCGFMFSFIVNIGRKKSSLGFTSMGGVFGIIIGAYIMFRIFKDRMLIQSYLTVFPLIYSISKIGCFFGGCCGGLPYNGPLAVNYLWHGELANPTLTFPVPLLESAVFMLIFIFVMLLLNKVSFRVHLAVNGIICFAAKFGLDFMRSSHVGVVISINQMLCLLVLALIIVVTILSDKIFPEPPVENIVS